MSRVNQALLGCILQFRMLKLVRPIFGQALATFHKNGHLQVQCLAWLRRMMLVIMPGVAFKSLQLFYKDHVKWETIVCLVEILGYRFPCLVHILVFEKFVVSSRIQNSMRNPGCLGIRMCCYRVYREQAAVHLKRFGDFFLRDQYFAIKC